MGQTVLGRCVLLAITAVFAATFPATAQGFETSELNAQLRDAVIHPPTGTAFAAVYDRNQVWQINLATGEVIREIDVDRGPAYIAFSPPADVVAVVNKLAESVSLIRVGDGAVFATIPVGDGPADIATLPTGGFAVANGFSDTISLIDPTQPGRVGQIDNVSSVPNAVAASESKLAVAVRTPVALLLYDPGASAPSATVELPAVANALAAVSGNRFVAATDDGLVLVDGATARILRQADVIAADVVAHGPDIFALTANAVVKLDDTLQAQEDSWPLAARGMAMAAWQDAAVVTSPAEKQWHVRRGSLPTPPTTRTAAQPAAEPPEPRKELPTPAEPMPAAEPEPREQLAEVEADQPEPARKPAEVEAQPARDPAEQPSEGESVSQPAARPDVPTTPEEAAQPQTPSVVAQEEPAATRQPRRPRRGWQAPLALDRPRPPDFPRRPSAAPLGDEEPPGLSSGLAGLRPFGQTEGGFVMPDFTQRKAFQADESEFAPGGIATGTGNVYFEVEDTIFTMDNFTYNPETGEFHGWGNVRITQAQSYLTADEIYLTSKPAEEEDAEAQEQVREAPIDAPDRYVEDDGERLLASIQGTNVHLVEPAREFTAEYLDYDFETQTGSATNAEGKIGIFYFGAEEIVLAGEETVDATNVWVSTCDCEHDYYRLKFSRATIDEKEVFVGKSGRLELFNQPTPLWFPSWRLHGGRDGRSRFALDFDSGREADLGFFVNFAQIFAVTPELDLGYRIFPTEKEGVGLGVEGSYDFMNKPSSPLYRSEGEFQTMRTTEDSGYIQWYHRQEITPDLVALGQWEQWFEEDFVKEFYYDEQFRDRTEPRTFANLTYTQPRYIATGTVGKRTNSGIAETERLPEGTFHLLERELVDNLYFTYDGLAGILEREPSGTDSARIVNLARLTYDLNVGEALNIAPFVELDATYYSDALGDESGDMRFSSTTGVTGQTRLQRTYNGGLGFSGFKHIFVPSLTYSYRAEPTMEVEETPRFDSFDNSFARSRIEGKLDNIILGRDAESGETWQVARASFYAGFDFSNELAESEDLELEIDIRPRPAWGWLFAAERHRTDSDLDIDDPFAFQRGLLRLFNDVYRDTFDDLFNEDARFRFNARFGDFDRVLTFVYYDPPDPEARWNARVGYSFAETQDRVFNNELLYGAGYRVGNKWSLAFEHRFDIERGELTRQSYEIYRNFADCIDVNLGIRDRESGLDYQIQFTLTALPGTSVKF